MKVQEIKALALKKFPTLVKVYPNTVRTVKNHINGREMYLMDILLGNGSKGMPFTFSCYTKL